MRLKPTKIICIGLNYKDHAKEMNKPIPDEPVIFMKPVSTVIYDGDAIIYPGMTKELHYECELAVVIKDKTENINPEEAAKHIKGFTCANDVTARDLQRRDGQWIRAKSFDTFCPLGPRIVKDINPDNLAIKTYLNGELKQSSNTSNMIFPVRYLVSFISRIMPLQKDDVIITGTPPGIGEMKVGDEVVIEIEGIGRLTNYVK